MLNYGITRWESTEKLLALMLADRREDVSDIAETLVTARALSVFASKMNGREGERACSTSSGDQAPYPIQSFFADAFRVLNLQHTRRIEIHTFPTGDLSTDLLSYSLDLPTSLRHRIFPRLEYLSVVGYPPLVDESSAQRRQTRSQADPVYKARQKTLQFRLENESIERISRSLQLLRGETDLHLCYHGLPETPEDARRSFLKMIPHLGGIASLTFHGTIDKLYDIQLCAEHGIKTARVIYPPLGALCDLLFPSAAHEL